MQQSWGQLGSSQRARPTGSRQVPFKVSGAADPIRPLLSRGALLRALGSRHADLLRSLRWS